MRIPKVIKAFGFKYKVKLKKKVIDRGKRWDGLIRHRELVIELDKKQNIQRIEKNFFHELTHLIGCEQDTKLTEHETELISNGFYHILKDNNLLK